MNPSFAVRPGEGCLVSRLAKFERALPAVDLSLSIGFGLTAGNFFVQPLQGSDTSRFSRVPLSRVAGRAPLGAALPRNSRRWRAAMSCALSRRSHTSLRNSINS